MYLPSTHSGKYGDDRLCRSIFIFYAKMIALTLMDPSNAGKFCSMTLTVI